jgi:Flp pilus assembly protein TadB
MIDESEELARIAESHQNQLVTRQRQEEVRFQAQADKVSRVFLKVFLVSILGGSALFVYSLFTKQTTLTIVALIVTVFGILLGYSFRLAGMLRRFKEWMG